MPHGNPLPRRCKRTVLRKVYESDLSHFQAYRCDPEVARYQSWELMTDAEARHFLQQVNTAAFLVPGEWYQLGIAELESNLLIGDIGICVDAGEQQAEIGFSLNRNYQKQGLARESVHAAIELIFEQRRVNCVVGITDERNLASIKLLRALSMKQIETNETEFRGEPCVELTYLLTR